MEPNAAGAEQLPAAVDYIPQSPISDSYPGKKRDLELTFPDLSPDRASKRIRSYSHSPRRPTALQHKSNDDAIDNNGVTVDDGDTTAIASESCEMKQAQPVLPLDPPLLQETSAPERNTLESTATPNLDGVEHLLERSRNEICRHIEIIKQNTPNGQIDIDTTGILVGEIFNIMAANNLATPEEIAKMRCIFFPSNNMPITPARFELDQTSSRSTTSPLSDLSSLPSLSELNSLPPPSFPISESAAAVPFTAISIIFQNKATQTEQAPINTHNDTLHDPATHHRFSDTELWERELESIRRFQPVVTGIYTTVNVPLRETGVKNDHSLIPISQSDPGYSLRSGAVTSRNSGRENCDVISLHDTDDEDKAIPTYNSHLVGGGDLIYCETGVAFVPTDDEEEMSTRGCHSRYENQPNENRGTVDDLADYEDDDIDENIRKEEVRYSNKPTVSMGRYDGNDTSDDGYDNANDQTDRRDDCDLNYHDVMGRSRSEKRGRASYEHATTSYGINDAGRARSRSPEYQRDRSSEKKPYRENRHYVRRYTSNDSLTCIRREKLYDAAHTDSPVGARRENSYNYAEQRYIRDEPENPCFYGYGASARLSREAEKVLRYQDRFSDVGEIPGPKSGLRLKLDDYVYDVGLGAAGLERDIKRVTQETFYASETLNEEQALQQFWVNQSTKLYKGFPLVEEIGFVTVGNHVNPEGDCYWRALAYVLHGKPARWDMIKADHLVYIQHVLSDKTHPRHQLYAKLNTQFFETTGGVLKNGQDATTPKFKANIWQLLHLPHSWTPGVMQQITADLYNIHLVTFTYDRAKNMCSEVSVRGAYNSRHVFMLFKNKCHFQPLTVNEYLS